VTAGKLRVFASDGASPLADLAAESALLEEAAAGATSLMLSSWSRPVVVLGYAQNASDVDLRWCRSHSIPVLRRLSGGTGVLHCRDLSVSLAFPASHEWARGIVSLYGRFLDVLEPTLHSVGSSVTRLEKPARSRRERSSICFEDQLADTLAVNGRKAVGCAQTRRRGAVLIHGAVLLGLDAALYARVFRASEERIKQALTPAVEGVAPEVIAETLVTTMARALDARVELTRWPGIVERHRAPYATEHWAPVPP
jgi:lipoate-protein ligase A